MKEMRNILGWLGMQEQENILADSRKHIEETYQTVQYFAQAIHAFVQGDLQEKMAAIKQVHESEHRADALKVKVINHLTNTILLPPDREELYAFSRTIDRIANRTNGAAKLLAFLEEQPPQAVLKNIAAATELIVTAIGILREAILVTINNDLVKALEYCDQIARVEHQADDQKTLLIEAVLHADLKPPSLLVCYHLADHMEEITDKIRDAVSFVKAIVIKSK